jgi:hypothetical protein
VVPAWQIPDLSEYGQDFQEAPAQYTAVDGDGLPVEVASARTNRYLVEPPRWRIDRCAEVIDVKRIQPLGYYHITVGKAGPEEGTRRRKTPDDPQAASVVTVDSSVILAGLKPSLFRPGDALFMSVAIAIDLSSYIIEYTDGDGSEPGWRGTVGTGRGWFESTPIPIDWDVLGAYRAAIVAVRQAGNPGDLDRTDLLCAATAMVYKAAMYTTKPEAYKGIVKGLKVLKYGPTRNKDADDDPQYPPVPNPPPPPPSQPVTPPAAT